MVSCLWLLGQVLSAQAAGAIAAVVNLTPLPLPTLPSHYSLTRPATHCPLIHQCACSLVVVSLSLYALASALQPRTHPIIHQHAHNITCTSCCDEIKGVQDQDLFSCSFSDFHSTHCAHTVTLLVELLSTTLLTCSLLSLCLFHPNSDSSLAVSSLLQPSSGDEYHRRRACVHDCRRNCSSNDNPECNGLQTRWCHAAARDAKGACAT